MKRAVIIALTCAGVSLVLPADAHADGPLDGVYSLTTNGEVAAKWTIRSDCTRSCVADIASSQGWRGYAELSEGRWAMSVYQGRRRKSSYPSDGQSCVLGGDRPLVNKWSWDAATLTGTLESVSGDECEGPLTTTYASVALSKIEKR